VDDKNLRGLTGKWLVAVVGGLEQRVIVENRCWERTGMNGQIVMLTYQSDKRRKRKGYELDCGLARKRWD